MSEFVLERHGEPALQRVLAALSEKDAAVFRSPAACDWYPLAQHLAIEAKLLDVLYAGDYSKAFEVGRYDLGASVGKVYRFLFQFLEPAFLFKRSARLWSTYFDQGALVVEQRSPNEAVARMEGLMPTHPVFCHDLRGSLTGGLEVCGAKGAKVVHTECRQRGAAACVFVATW